MIEEKPLLCDYRNRDNEPCYGEINQFCDGEYWITYCEGHQAVPNGGAYVPKDPIRRIIFSQQNSKIRALEEENDLLKSMVSFYSIKKMLKQGENEIEIPEERLRILYD